MTHKLNHTATVAVDQHRKYSKIDQHTPRGVKLILVTTERVAVFGVLTEVNRRHFTHWEPLARIPDDEPGPPLVISPCPNFATGNKPELRGGYFNYVKQYEDQT
jgi:hypothetical protein